MLFTFLIFTFDFPSKKSLPSLTKINVSVNFIVELFFHSIWVSSISIKPSWILDFKRRFIKFLLFWILFALMFNLKSIFLLLKIPVLNNSAIIALEPNAYEIFISSAVPSRVE